MTFCETVWLIDDDEVSNYLTANTLNVNNFSTEVRSFTNAQEALDELKSSVESNAFPDLIFLDLNMPVLDGWDFIKYYRKFPKEKRETCTLYILSSSVNLADINKAKLCEGVRDFFHKPLNKMNLAVIKFHTKQKH